MQDLKVLSGYQVKPWASAAYALLVCATGGGALALDYALSQATLWRMQSCPLSKAQFVHAKVCIGWFWGSSGRSLFAHVLLRYYLH